MPRGSISGSRPSATAAHGADRPSPARERPRASRSLRLTPAAADTPIHHVFRASPAAGAATVYTVEIAASPGDPVPENNTRSVLVQGPSRPRRVLLVEGAPGFEHSFLKRAWAGDRGLEVDAVVRKGTDEQGAGTFYVQAARARSEALVSGFPADHRSAVRLRCDRARERRRRIADRLATEAATGFVSPARRRSAGAGVRVVRPAGPHGYTAGGGVAAATDQRFSTAGRPVTAGGANRLALTAQGTAHPDHADRGRRGGDHKALGRRASARRGAVGRGRARAQACLRRPEATAEPHAR